MKTFDRRKISEIGKVITGKTPPTKNEDNFGGRIPFITIPDLRSSNRLVRKTDRYLTERGASTMENQVLPEGAVMMSCLATVGLRGVTTGTACTNQQINSVICDESVCHPQYLYYALETIKPELKAQGGGGSVYLNVSKSKFSNLEVPLPPLPVQRRIADILGALDDKIALNRRMNETLEEMAQTLYRHWFVDFGPFQDRKFKDTEELGPIPKGWEVGELGDFCTVNRETVNKDDPPDPIEYIKISGVNEGRVEETEIIEWEESPTRANRRVQDGDIVWSKVRPNRKGYFLCLEPPENLVVSTGFATITPNQLPFTWVYLTLTTEDFVEYLTARATGAAYPSVRLEAFRNAKVIIPGKEELNAFHEKVEALFRLQRANERENETLAETRDYLLPKLISGEIEVEVAEEAVESIS